MSGAFQILSKLSQLSSLLAQFPTMGTKRLKYFSFSQMSKIVPAHVWESGLGVPGEAAAPGLQVAVSWFPWLGDDLGEGLLEFRTKATGVNKTGQERLSLGR